MSAHAPRISKEAFIVDPHDHRPSRVPRRIVLVVVAAAVVGAAAWWVAARAEPAAANGADGQFCTPNQIVATMNQGDQSTGAHVPERFGAIRITARPGEACHLEGAPAATVQGVQHAVTSSNPDNEVTAQCVDQNGVVVPDENCTNTHERGGHGNPSTRIVVSPTQPAWVPVSWPDEASPNAQHTPRSITLQLPGGSPLIVPWGGGGVDAVHARPITVGPAQSGPVTPGSGG